MAAFINSLISVFSNPSTVLASIGLIIATSSFISGLQLVRGTTRVEKIIHRYNGFATVTLYFALAVLAMFEEGFRIWPLLAWFGGISVLLLKIWIVRRKVRRGYKYVSWMGATMILVWFYVLYIHIPV